jgi:aldehyde dehydrogenase (NAD+)
VWSESINLALDIAPKIKAGVVWINSTNLFDAAAGFGGYRESGFGREGGREGMYEYLKRDRPEATTDDLAAGRAAKASSRSAGKAGAASSVKPIRRAAELDDPDRGPLVDRTAKMFIGGKQARPDSGYSRRITGVDGRVIGEVGDGNRKDLRNAVEAAHAALGGWSKATGHNRAQILYYIAENLAARGDEFAKRISAMTGGDGAAEVEAAVSRLFTYGAWADKYDGQVHQVPLRGVAMAMNEPIGVIGLAAPEEHPLLGLVSLIGPAIAMGNTVVVVPSEQAPLAATDFYQVLETSDLPPGVVNIVTGPKDSLAKTLAEHDDVDAVWYFGSPEGVKAVELASAGNMKRTWAESEPRPWYDAAEGEGREFLREATQVKNIWIPYGE